jgi:hypothetical protein
VPRGRSNASESFHDGTSSPFDSDETMASSSAAAAVSQLFTSKLIKLAELGMASLPDDRRTQRTAIMGVHLFMTE